jgi:hypothetical protein
MASYDAARGQEMMDVRDSERLGCTTKPDEETGTEMAVSLVDGCVIKAAETIVSRAKVGGH